MAGRQGMSLTYSLNRMGEIIPPSVLPDFIRQQVDVAIWKDDSNIRLLR